MNLIRLLLTALAACLFLASEEKSSAASEAAASAWVEEGASRLRLVAGGPGPDGSLRAGLEIRLEPGWKTYWVNPGPTGLPPKLDFAGSANLARAEPLWPAPVRFDDGGTASVGYTGHFVVPLRIVPEDPSKPVSLKAVMDFGICENICVPAHAELTLALEPGARPDAFAAAQLAGFEKRVPKPAKLGGEGELAVVSAVQEEGGLKVEVRFPAGETNADLFAKADGAPVGVPKRLDKPGHFLVGLRAGELPRTVDLVAVAGGEAIRVPVALDDLAPRP